jgi:outer membrane protein TolC
MSNVSRQGLILQVYESFYAALMNEQGVRVNEDGVTIAQKHLELAKARFDAGSAARLDVLRAEVELSNAKAKLIRARSETDVAYQRLRTVLSLSQGEPLQLAGSLDEIPEVPSAAVIETALGSRGLSLLETEWQLMQAKYGQIVAAARTRFAAGV